MLRITPSKANAEQVKKYYVKQSLEAYYSSEGQDFNGVWGGKGAERLGLAGNLQEEAFGRLCDNLHPLTGEKLTARMKENRRIGYDVNWHVPKSVSLSYMYSKDERIIRAMREAVAETMQDMEADAACRVRKGGRDEDRKTGELVYAEIIHMTSRPVNGVPDPHSHVHCYVFNATWDETEGAWKALQFGLVMEEANHYEKAFHSRLETKLRELGLGIVPTEYAFEVEGISRELNRKFSRRTEAINVEAQERGIIDPVEKAKLGALTRERKVKDVPLSELEPLWRGRLLPEEKNALEGIKMVLQRSRAAELTEYLIEAAEYIPADDVEGRVATQVNVGEAIPSLIQTAQEPSSRTFGTRKYFDKITGKRISLNRATRPIRRTRKSVTPTEHDRRAVAFAIEHLFERASAVTEKQLIAEALQSWCLGKATLKGIEAVIAETPLLRSERNGKTYVTTEAVLAEENRLIDRCVHGRWKFPALNPNWEIENMNLNLQQKAAVFHVLGSRDAITGISGKAGVGKTTLLQEIKQGIESSGKTLVALAPSSEAARDVLRSEGFPNAETVAYFLKNEGLQEQARGGVVLVDEAGLIPTRMADRLFALAENLQARVVLVGDPDQHHAVERGQAFELLQKFGHMKVAEVNEIMRQQGPYKEFVEQVIAKDYEGAFRSLHKMNAVVETTLDERQIILTNDYLTTLAQGKTAHITAPTHAECKHLTDGIRSALKERGILKNGVTWEILRDLSWTAAAKRDPEHYEKGLIVEINNPIQDGPYVPHVGDRLEINCIKNGKVTGVDKHGFVHEIPLSQPDAFRVCERDAIEICEGDKIQIKANGRSAENHPLTNKRIYTVDYVGNDGNLVLENGWRVKKDFAHLDHGWATTSHSVQGKTVDFIFVVQTAELSACASDARQFYVSTTRGREGLKMYTGDMDWLRENVSRLRERPMATELLHEEQAEQETRERGHERVSEMLGTMEMDQTERIHAQGFGLLRGADQVHGPEIDERCRKQEMEMGM